MKYLLLGAVSAAVLSLSCSSSRAHHAFAAEFDASKPVLLKGKITRIEAIADPARLLELNIEVP